MNAIEDLLTHPHLTVTGFFETQEHPSEGTLTTPHHPVSYSRSPAEIRRLVPRRGEHNEGFLK